MFTIFNDGLLKNMNSRWLRQIFIPNGEITDAYVSFKKRKDNDSLFGFIRYLKKADAERAIRYSNGRIIKGKTLKVWWAKYHRNQEDKRYVGDAAMEHKSVVSKLMEEKLEEMKSLMVSLFNDLSNKVSTLEDELQQCLRPKRVEDRRLSKKVGEGNDKGCLHIDIDDPTGHERSDSTLYEKQRFEKEEDHAASLHLAMESTEVEVLDKSTCENNAGNMDNLTEVPTLEFCPTSAMYNSVSDRAKEDVDQQVEDVETATITNKTPLTRAIGSSKNHTTTSFKVKSRAPQLKIVFSSFPKKISAKRACKGAQVDTSEGAEPNGTEEELNVVSKKDTIMVQTQTSNDHVTPKRSQVFRNRTSYYYF